MPIPCFVTNRIHVFFIVALAAFGLTACDMQPPDLSSGITLLTHNLHAERRILEPFLDIMREANPDIVVLQEVSQEAATLFDRELGDVYPYRAEALEDGHYNGQLILSRYPIREQAEWHPDQRLLRAVVEVNSTLVTVYNVHPTSPGNTNLNTAPRSADIALMLEQAAAETNPTLVAGDFNSEPWSEDYASVAALFGDAFVAVGEGNALTYPDYSAPQAQLNARLPLFSPLVLRLDYIFYSDSFTPVSAQVWPTSGGSDHRPVVATLLLGSTP